MLKVKFGNDHSILYQLITVKEFKKFTNFTGKQLEISYNLECEMFRVLFLYEHKHIGRFSNLH